MLQEMATLGNEVIIDSIGELYLDPENPRIPPDIDRTDDQLLFKYLYDVEGVADVVSSLQENGWLDVEPLLLKPRLEGGWTVIEGNRRLTALKSLFDQNCRATLNSAPSLGALEHSSPFPMRARDVSQTDPSQVLAFLGYKHVAGARPWGAMEKARFVQENLGSLEIGELARMIGAKRNDAIRWLRALQILDQAENEGIYAYEDRKRKRGFGVLYTALTDSNIQRYLGIAEGEVGVGELVPADKLENLENFLVWTLGSISRAKDPVLPESRQIGYFGEVLVNPAARAVLERTSDFAQARALTSYRSKEVDRHLNDAHASLRAVIMLESEELEASAVEQLQGIKKTIRIIERAAGIGTLSSRGEPEG